jgi:large subunit ribosomal protein L10
MPNAEKIGAVAELTEHFASSSAAVITEYRGLTVKQVTDLRKALGRDTTYSVVKNTLTKRAAADAGVAIDESLLTGPTAIAFVKGDPVEAARGLRDFAKTNPLLVIKGGVLDGKNLSAAEVAKIADLESREVLLSRMAGALKALPTRAAALFQAPLSQMARLAKALEEKKPAEAAAAPVAETVTEAVVETVPETVTETVPETVTETVPETVTESVTDEVPAPEAPAAEVVEEVTEAAPAAAETVAEEVPETPAEPAE